MAKKKTTGGVDRRAFIAGVATGAGAAAAATVQQATAATPPVAPPQKLAPPTGRLLAQETQNIGAEIDRWHVKNPGSDYMVDVIKHVGYDYITCMPGSTFRGIQESITNYGGNSKPELLSCTHEEISAAMAAGYAQMAGKPMAILVHNTVGLQHASMNIYNAYAARLPMVVMVGNIADGATRRPGVEWFHTATDVAAIVRGYVKYDTQPASLQSWGEEFMKAHSMATTPPYEPTLIIVDADLAEMPVEKKPLPLPAFHPVKAPIADPAALADVAKALVGAQFPVIIADRVARTPAGMAGLVQLAELLQIPVVDYGNRNNFPTNHHLNQTWDRTLLGQADVILALELADLFGAVGDVPDLPIRATTMRIKPTTNVIAINAMYMAGAGNYQDQNRFFQPSAAIAGDTEASLPYLIEAVNRALTSERKAQNAARAQHFSDAWVKRRQSDLAALSVGWDSQPINVARFVQEVYAKVKGDDFSIVSPTFYQGQVQNRLWDLDKWTHVCNDGAAYGVGFGLPCAVGAAIAARDQGRYAINFQGDGDFMVAPGALWTAAHHKVPLLTIVHNNRAWHQETMHLQRMANRRERQPEHAKTGTVITDPNIDYAKTAESMGVHGEGPITDPSQLGPAIERALKVVKSGMPALIDVVAQGR